MQTCSHYIVSVILFLCNFDILLLTLSENSVTSCFQNTHRDVCLDDNMATCYKCTFALVGIKVATDKVPLMKYSRRSGFDKGHYYALGVNGSGYIGNGFCQINELLERTYICVVSIDMIRIYTNIKSIYIYLYISISIYIYMIKICTHKHTHTDTHTHIYIYIPIIPHFCAGFICINI